MAFIIISARNKTHAKHLSKLDEHLGYGVTITEVDVLRKPNTDGFSEGIYKLWYKVRK